MRIREILLPASVLLLAALLAACDSDPEAAPDLLFLVKKPVEGERIVMDALYEGSVVESEGCLRFGDEPERHTVVWPPGFSLTNVDGSYVVLDERGRTVGQIGRFFRFGGGEVETLWEDGPVAETARVEALRRCPGRYWIVGEVPGSE